MSSDSLAGCTVLVVEDEPLIALDICDGLQGAGASVLSAYTLCNALHLADHPDVAVAVLDYGLSDGEGAPLCERLKERGIPFVLHTGYAHVPVVCGANVVLPKPATHEQLVDSVMRALGQSLRGQRECTSHGKPQYSGA